MIDQLPAMLGHEPVSIIEILEQISQRMRLIAPWFMALANYQLVIINGIELLLLIRDRFARCLDINYREGLSFCKDSVIFHRVMASWLESFRLAQHKGRYTMSWNEKFDRKKKTIIFVENSFFNENSLKVLLRLVFPIFQLARHTFYELSLWPRHKQCDAIGHESLISVVAKFHLCSEKQ